MRKTLTILILDVCVTLLFIVSSAYGNDDNYKIRFGIGYSVIDGSNVLNKQLNRFSRSKNERQVPVYPKECFSPPGVTEVNNVKFDEKKFNIFDLLYTFNLHGFASTITCGQTTVIAHTYFEASQNGNNWQILGNIPDSLLNNYIFKYSKNLTERAGSKDTHKKVEYGVASFRNDDLIHLFGIYNKQHLVALKDDDRRNLEYLREISIKAGMKPSKIFERKDYYDLIFILDKVNYDNFFPTLRKAYSLTSSLDIALLDIRSNRQEINLGLRKSNENWQAEVIRDLKKRIKEADEIKMSMFKIK